MGISHHHFRVGFRFFIREIVGFVKNPIFLIITVLGNIALFSGATIFHHIEADSNPMLNSYFDSVYWSMMTITTVGYGDIVPMTTAGKVVTIFLTFIGTGLFLAYVALLSATFVKLEATELEHEVEALKKGIKKTLKKPNRP